MMGLASCDGSVAASQMLGLLRRAVLDECPGFDVVVVVMGLPLSKLAFTHHTPANFHLQPDQINRQPLLGCSCCTTTGLVHSKQQALCK
jgi:hypothetical protein